MTEQLYTPGKIVEYSWGYDQTNIDYFIITKRQNDFVTLQPIGQKNRDETGFMSGHCEPDPDKLLPEKPIRRKVHYYEGKEIGLAIKSYGWASLWDGRPSCWSNYA